MYIFQETSQNSDDCFDISYCKYNSALMLPVTMMLLSAAVFLLLLVILQLDNALIACSYMLLPCMSVAPRNSDTAAIFRIHIAPDTAALVLSAAVISMSSDTVAITAVDLVTDSDFLNQGLP